MRVRIGTPVVLALLLAGAAPAPHAIDVKKSSAQFSVSHVWVENVKGTVPIIGGSVALAEGSEIPTSATAVLDATRLAVSLRRSRSVHLARLAEAVDLPLLYLPYVFARDHGLRVTRLVADHLAEELGR